jgi:hypothetical protein
MALMLSRMLLLMDWSTATPGKKAMLNVAVGLVGSALVIGLKWAVHRRSPDWTTLAYMGVSYLAGTGILYLWLRHRERRAATAK